MALMILPFFGALSVFESLMALATVCLAYLTLKHYRTKIPEGLCQLPGPKALPVIGNLLDLGKAPYLSLTEMSKRYGDVFQIQLGSRPVVVLSGLETVRQALIKQGDDFSGRPDLYSFSFINDGKSLAFSTDKAGIWRTRRKLAYSALRSFSTLECKTSEYSCVLEEHVCKECTYLIKELDTVMKTEGKFDPFRYIVVSVANVICGMCFGRRYDHHDQELLGLVNLSEDFVQVTGSGNPADFIPVLQYLPSNSMKKFVNINNRFCNFVQRIVSEHYVTFDKVLHTRPALWNINQSNLLEWYYIVFLVTNDLLMIHFQDNIRDITDSLIDHCEDRKLDENSNVQISDEKIVGIVNDLFGAGTFGACCDEADETVCCH